MSGSQSGIGTTTVACRLAKELALLGKRVVLVDAHPAEPALAHHWGIQPRGTLADVLAGKRTLVEVLQSTGSGVQILPGHWDAGSPPKLNHQAVEHLLAELRTLNDADLVLADVGSGMSPWAHRFWQAAQQVLLVTTPDPKSVMESYAAIKLADAPTLGKKLRIVVNQSTDPQQARGVFARLDQTCRRFLDITLAGGLPVATNQPPDEHADDGAGDDFSQSVRLLAAEVIGYSMAVAQRHSGRTTRQRQAPSAAVAIHQ